MTDPNVANLSVPFPTEHAELTLAGPAGRIELLVDIPEDTIGDDIAIICHGLPATGGSVHGRVTHLIDKSLRQLGLRTVRFNFRGVGQSSGEHDGGIGETDDLFVVAQWVKHTNPRAKLYLAGYDFGSYVTARAAQVLECKHLISVSPPVDQFDFASLSRPDCHWLVVHGEEDEHTPVETVKDWINQHENPPHLILMQEAGHKYHRRLLDLRGVIKNGVRRLERLAREEAAGAETS